MLRIQKKVCKFANFLKFDSNINRKVIRYIYSQQNSADRIRINNFLNNRIEPITPILQLSRIGGIEKEPTFQKDRK
jgi:hypothetical protein